MIQNSKKILFISQYAGIIGGLENYIFQVANLLKKNGHKCYCLYVEKTFNSEKFLETFEQSWNFEQLHEAKLVDFDIKTIHKISDSRILKIAIDNFKPTAFIHDHDYFCPKGYKYLPYKRKNCAMGFNSTICGICSSMVPPRHIAMFGLKNTFLKNFVLAKRLLNQIKRCPKFIVLSHFMKNELDCNGIDENKIKILNPFVEIPDIDENNICGSDIVFAGQQVMSKGTMLFLDAIRKMKSKNKVYILGRGPRLEAFKEASKNMGLSDRVSFKGFVANVGDYYKRAALLAFPSMWQEPFGLTGIEAMSFAKPVVAFNVGGVGEWLKDNYNGILVPERNTTLFANAMDKLIEDSALRNKFGQNARNFVVENYTDKTFLKNFFDLL